MTKVKYFDTKNITTSLKGIGTSIVTFLVVLIPLMVSSYFINRLDLLFVGVLFGILTLGLQLLTWGYFARKFWGWK